MPEKTIPHREPSAEKVQQVGALVALLDRCGSLILTDYRGLSVAEKADLTRRLRAAGAEYHVVKNRLFQRAYGERGEELSGVLAGPTAIVFAGEDPVAPARVITEFIREKRKASVKGAVVEGRFFDPAGVAQLAQLPPRPVLMAQVAGGLAAPLSSMAFCLNGVLGSFARALDALHEQKSAAGE